MNLRSFCANRRWAGILAVGLALFVLIAPSAQADADLVQVNPDGSVSRMTIPGMVNNVYKTCLTASGLCEICGSCHAKSTNRYDDAMHRSTYFPRFATTIRSGASHTIGGGRTLTSDGKSICVQDSRGDRQCYSTIGTKVLNDSSGKLLAVISDQPPKKQ